MNKIKTAFLATITLVLIAMVLLLWNIHQDKSEYEVYLSDILSGQVCILVSNINTLERTLTEVIEYQTVSKEQATVLYRNSKGMMERESELFETGVRLGKIKRNQIDKAISTSTKLAKYFEKIYTSLSEEDLEPLTEVQKEGFEEFQKLVSLYKEIAKSCVNGVSDTGVKVEYWDEYSTDGVNKRYWVKLINQLEEVSPGYEDFVLLNRSTDIWNVN